MRDYEKGPLVIEDRKGNNHCRKKMLFLRMCAFSRREVNPFYQREYAFIAAAAEKKMLALVRNPC
jgi:hypothetical protein